MKNFLLKLFKSYRELYVQTTKTTHSKILKSIREITPVAFQRNAHTTNFRKTFLRERFILMPVVFLILFTRLDAQITDTTIFPLNTYLQTTSDNPYPLVNNSVLNAIDTSKFVNVMNYGAKGDGKTYDDVAIVNAFKAASSAGTGVIFPSGRTFIVSKTSTITLTHNITVWAYGATIKMAPFTRYSFLSLRSGLSSGNYKYSVVWLGGTLDGDRNNQSYPTSPSGKYEWVESHGRFLGFEKLEFALIKDVNVINVVVDGIGIDGCKLGVIADSKASNGAPFKYSEVQEQGTYFKVTRIGFKSCYFINLKCEGGSIGIHASYPEKQVMDKQTQIVIRNCYIHNARQNPIHIEDSYKVFMYQDTVDADPDHGSCHFSDRTGVISAKKSVFINSKLNFEHAVALKIALVDSNTFIGNESGLPFMLEAPKSVVTHTTFDGKATYQARAPYVRWCKFSNFGSLALSGADAVDSTSFSNGTKPANCSKGGFITPACVFTNISQPNNKSEPSSNDWKNVFSSYIDVYSDTKKYLGRITCNVPTQAVNVVSSNSSEAINSVINGNNDILKGEVINIYPNPVTDMLHVKLSEKISGKTSLNIYDQQGRLVQAETIYKNTPVLFQTINIKALGAGFYVLQIVNEHKKTSQQFIITK